MKTGILYVPPADDFENRYTGVYYTGDHVAQCLATIRHRRDVVVTTTVARRGIHVVFTERGDPTAPRAWGGGRTEDEATRYAIGAAFHPSDTILDGAPKRIWFGFLLRLLSGGTPGYGAAQ